jgi:hypothetical protein
MSNKVPQITCNIHKRQTKGTIKHLFCANIFTIILFKFVDIVITHSMLITIHIIIIINYKVLRYTIDSGGVVWSASFFDFHVFNNKKNLSVKLSEKKISFKKKAFCKSLTKKIYLNVYYYIIYICLFVCITLLYYNSKS